MRCIANCTTQYFEVGEIVDLEPDLWKAELDAQLLSPVDENGERIIGADSSLDGEQVASAAGTDSG